ncbi:MAG: PIN domain-containing protein [Candidatus Bathyarchaeia archaeon]
MVDCVIATTAKKHNAPVITDDPYFKEIKDVKTRWPRK